jgi:hypothetical protein
MTLNADAVAAGRRVADSDKLHSHEPQKQNSTTSNSDTRRVTLKNTEHLLIIISEKKVIPISTMQKNFYCLSLPQTDQL